MDQAGLGQQENKKSSLRSSNLKRGYCHSFLIPYGFILASALQALGIRVRTRHVSQRGHVMVTCREQDSESRDDLIIILSTM